MEQIKFDPASSRSQSDGQSSSKASPAIVARGIQFLFSAYRRDDFSDPEGFVAQLGTILTDFPEEVVNYVTSPKTGLQRRSKWPPTISEVLTACEEHQEFLTKLRKPKPAFAERLPAPLLKQRPQGYMAQVFVPEGHSRYAKLCEWAKEADPIWWKYGKSSAGIAGIWVSHDAWDGVPTKTFTYSASN
jgi:hypothetical protein